MKPIGIIFFIIGFIALIISMSQGVTVRSSGFNEIVNFGLMGDKILSVIISCSVALMGIILMAAGMVKDALMKGLKPQTESVKEIAAKPVIEDSGQKI
jgi:hypothetical protein